MTSTQIKDLVERLDERCDDGAGINVTKEDVNKLIHERQILLNAMKDLLAEQERGGLSPCECSTEDVARATINQVEAP